MSKRVSSLPRATSIGLAIATLTAIAWWAACCTEYKEPLAVSGPPDGPDAGAETGDARPDARDAAQESAPDADADTGVEAPDVTLPDGAADYAWLFDPDAWLAVPGIEGCVVHEADPAKVAWPGHTWASCGTGCRVASVLDGPARATAHGNRSSARIVDGMLVMSATVGVEVDPPVSLVARYGLDEAAPRTLIRVQGQTQLCLGGFAYKSAGRVLQMNPLQSGSPNRIGIAPQESGSRTSWPLPPLPSGTQWFGFDFDTGWGGVFDLATVRIAKQPGSTEMDIVHSGAYIELPVAIGDGVFWNDWEAPRATLWSWTKTGAEAKRLIQGPWDVASYDVSTTRIVWLGVQGPSASSGGYEEAKLYWSPFTTDPAQVVMHEGPTLPVPTKAGEMYTSGDWAVVPACQNDDSCAMLVIRLSDERVWSIPARTGPGYYQIPFAITDTDVIALESVQPSQGGPSPNWFLRLLRYDLSQLDSYATSLQ